MKIMIVIHLTKMKLRRISPINLGFSVFELSKLHRYEPCYDKLLPYFGEKSFNVFILIRTHLYQALYEKILSKI